MKRKLKIRARSASLVAAGTLAAYVAGTGQNALAEPLAAGHKDKADAQASTITFDIPEGPLSTVLEQFRQASGMRVSLHLPPDQVSGFHSKGARGALTNEAALQAILADTGLGFKLERGGTRAEIQIQNAEQVSVTASSNSVGLGQFTESLTDTPQTVNVIPQYILQEQGVTSFKDSLKNAPGISLAAGEGGQQGDNLTIRGFSGRNDIFLDGIRDFGSYFRDSFNYESVDVIQGPASVEFGRGSTGGVVNQESKQPVTNRFIRPNVQFGTNGLMRGTLDTNLPLTHFVPNSAFRFNAVGLQSGVAGRDITKLRRWAIAPSLIFGLGRPTRFVLQYLHQYENSTPDYGVTWLNTLVSPAPTNTWYGLRDFNRMKLTPDVITARLEHDMGAHFNLRTSMRYGRYPRQVKVTEAIVNSTGTIAGVGAAINAPVAGKAYAGSYKIYSGYTSTCAIAATAAASCYAQNTPLASVFLRRNNISRNSTDDILWGRTELTSHFSVHGIENSAVVLLEGGRERTVTGNLGYFLADGVTAYTSYAPLLNPNPDDPTPAVIIPNAQTHVASQTFGINLLDTLRPLRWLSLSGGIRFDYFNSQSQPPTGAAVSRLDKQPTYRAAVVVKPTANGSVYFDYGTSFNPSAESLSLSANNATLPPEFNTTYEAGVKWDLMKNKLNVNGSYFRTTKENAKETNPLDSTQTILSGTQRVQGVQFGGLGHMPHRFDLIFGYAYLDSRVINSIANINISPFASVNLAFYNEWQERKKTNAAATPDARYNTAPFFLSSVGLPLTNVPKNTGNLWLTHGLPFRFSGGFGGNYVSARRSSAAAITGVYNTTAAQNVSNVPLAFRTVPGYLNLNAMISRSLTEHISAQVNFNNLTNKFYIEQPSSNRLIPGERFNTQFSIVSRF